MAGQLFGSTFRLLAVIALALTACSDGGTSSPTTASSTAVVASGQPLVDEIDDAITALEAELGGPQQYFEINATSQLVNLIVALNNGQVAQPWVYLDGEVSSTEGRPASGFTFVADALDFDPETVLGNLQSELPQSSADLFFVEGGEGGIVRYSVAVTSQQGGQLVVVLGPDGAVLSVDPN